MAYRRGMLFMIFIMMFVILLNFVLLVVFNQGLVDSQVVRSPWFIIFYQVMSFIVPLALWLGFHKEKLNAHLPHMRLGATNIICIVGLSFLLQPAMMVISGITNLFFDNEVSTLVMGMADYPLLLLFLAIAVTPAICEEVVFRGYIQKKFETKSFWVMALANGFFFGVMHFNPQQFFYAFAMGVIFAYMVYMTKSIRAAVISHFIMNASQVSLLWFTVRMTEFIEYYTETYNGQSDIDVYALPEEVAIIVALALLAFIAIFSTVGAVILFRYFAKHNKKRLENYYAKNLQEEVVEEGIVEEVKSKDRIIDASLILVIVALYVFFVFA